MMKAATSYRMVGDPTEGSILVAAAKAGALATESERSLPAHRRNSV